jgi:hypothetical protein
VMANYRRDRSILVHETQYHGKGSAGYADGQFINTTWRLAPVHLKAMEDFWWQCHEDGVVCSVRTVWQHLNETFGCDTKVSNCIGILDCIRRCAREYIHC